jgi:hypothetical protein
MRHCLAVIVIAGLSLAFAPDAMAQGKKKGAAKAECLNPIVCGPQPVKQIRKPKNEKFMRSAS